MDRPKRQTATATPAKPGGLPLTLGATGQLGRSPVMLDFAIDVSPEFVPVLSIQAVDVAR